MKRSWRISQEERKGRGRAARRRMRRRRSDIAECQAYFASIPETLFEMFSSISGDFQSLCTELKCLKRLYQK